MATSVALDSIEDPRITWSDGKTTFTTELVGMGLNVVKQNYTAVKESTWVTSLTNAASLSKFAVFDVI